VPYAHPYPVAPRGSGFTLADDGPSPAQCDAATEMEQGKCHTASPPAPGRSGGMRTAAGVPAELPGGAAS